MTNFSTYFFCWPVFWNLAFVVTYRWFEPRIISTCERNSDFSSFSGPTRGSIAFLWESVSSGLRYFIIALRGPYLSSWSQSPLWRNSMDGWRKAVKGRGGWRFLMAHRWRRPSKCSTAGDLGWWWNQSLQRNLFHFDWTQTYDVTENMDTLWNMVKD